MQDERGCGRGCGVRGAYGSVWQGVATGVSVLYPSMEKNGLIDIDILVQVIPRVCASR